MQMISESIVRIGALAYSYAGAICQPAIVFLLLSVFVNRRDLRNVLLCLLPRSTRVNLTAYFVDSFLIAAPMAYVAMWATDALNRWDLVLPLEKFMDSAPIALVVMLAVFFGDLIGYFRHRLEHSALLWPSHAMHHSDAQMNWVTLYRFHPINRLTTTLIDTGALVALGFPFWAIVANWLVRHNYGLLIHANLPWTYGIFGKVFVSPAMHRWHHVRQGPGVACNFATVFSVFDRAFGTFYLPGPCNVQTGVEGVNDRSYLSQLLLPFTSALRPVYNAVKKRSYTPTISDQL